MECIVPCNVGTSKYHEQYVGCKAKQVGAPFRFRSRREEKIRICCNRLASVHAEWNS